METIALRGMVLKGSFDVYATVDGYTDQSRGDSGRC